MSLPSPPETPRLLPGTQVLGTGIDLVHVPGLAIQLASPGTVLAERAFTPRERRDAIRKAAGRGVGDGGEAEHLAARWAAKEAFIKAWSQALAQRATAEGSGAAPPVIPAEEVDWRQVEVVVDRWGRPSLRLTGRLAGAVEASLGAGSSAPAHWLVSLSHDGDYAVALVLAQGRERPSGQAPGSQHPPRVG